MIADNTTSVAWLLRPGDQIRRTELHQQYGGRRQGGIGPSARTPNVFVFTDPTTGPTHGYRDGWDDNGIFHYTGEGQRGDQRFIQGNRAIRDHIIEGRALRVFDGAKQTVTYMGEFELADPPHYLADAPETRGGPTRQVIIFRLQPTSGVPIGTAIIASDGPAVTTVELEQHLTTSFEISPNTEPLTGQRREQPLLIAYAEHARSRGEIVVAHHYRPESNGRSLRCDAFNETTNMLIESKSSVSREPIRMAVGQLLDYARFEETQPVRKAVLVPSRPRQDLVAFLESVGIGLISPDGGRWLQEWPGSGSPDPA